MRDVITIFRRAR